MSSLVVAAISVGLALLVGLIAAIYWLSKSQKKQVKAETKLDAIIKAQEIRHEAEKIMVENTADESAWIRATAQRVLDSRRKS